MAPYVLNNAGIDIANCSRLDRFNGLSIYGTPVIDDTNLTIYFTTSISIKRQKASDVKMNGNEATKQPPPPPANNNNANNNNNTLLSHILPPSHILDDGRFIQLPPPTTQEKSTFFERAVASRQLIANDNDNGIQRRKKKAAKSTKKKKRSSEEEVDDAASTTSSIISNTKRRKKKKSKTIDTGQQYIHPLAMASAKLQSNGINELSKAINLNTLVIGNEYFGLSNIVNSQTPSGVGKMIDNVDNKSNMNNGDATTHSNNIQSTIDETIQKDQNLRTSYTLQNRHQQYKHTSTVLSRHSKRLSKSISIMQTIDSKLFTLRKQWKLCAPEHGVRTVGPVRSKEVIALDVDVYNNNRIIHPSSSTSTATSSQLGRIARRVPRYATIEIDDEYNIMNDIKSLRKKVKNVLVNLKKVTDDDDDILHPASTSSMELEEPQPKLKETTMSKTKAEPFAIADPTIGKIDHEFDPNKVPLLTLLFSIEKSCTGFVEFATLSSSFQSKSNDDNAENEKESHKEQSPDERVIEALQHSLFCASLFESMRSEIIQPTSSTASQKQQQQQQRQQKSSSSIAWLSSEMEESFLPPPTSMAGGDSSSSSSQLLCVVHCHEGEVKVQLDDEYSLTVKLIEAGTAAGCAGKAKSSLEETNTTATSSTTKQSDITVSGSQSPTRLKTLCRALLLHSQTLYHTHCMKTRNGTEKKKKNEEDKPITLGFARTKKEVKEPSPHILQQCVSLGCKFIIEKKIRLVLKVSCMFSFNVDIV